MFHSLRQNVRWNSTYAKIINGIKVGEAVSANDVRNAISKKSFTDAELKSLHEALSDKTSSDVTNVLLQYGLPQDFSLYFTLSKKAPQHQWDNHSIRSLLEHNPGRVFSATDLLRKHSSGPLSDEVREVVIQKLLLGEKNEQDEFVPSTDDVNKAIGVINELSSMEAAMPSLELLYEKLKESGSLSSLSSVDLDTVQWVRSKLALAHDRTEFLSVAQFLFNKDPSIFTKGDLSKILAYGGDLSSKELTETQKRDLEDFTAATLVHVEQNRLDLDKKDAESLLLRIQLMETYGMNTNNLELALQRFHEYQSHDKVGLELVQAKLVQALCYQAFKQNNETFFKMAETLKDPQSLTVATVARLILASSRFSSEKSLAIYNDYINQVSKDVNEATGRSPTGVLTEALMVGSLYDKDREFAHLLYEKAILSKMVTNEMELANMKKVFKVFGDSFVEDSWAVAQPIFGEYVLQCLRK